ncbi:MAG: Holliday junction resolvase-like protein [Candidatus Methanospirareceae archaeon]
MLLIIALIFLSWKYFELKGEIETRAREIFEKWKTRELKTQAELLFQDWKQKEEKRIREDAVKKSEAVIKGKVTEHLIPFFPNFKYNPKDARFIGTPVDLVVFDGLSEGRLRKVIFVEVKTGKAAGLSDRERLVRNCIEDKNVTYEIIHLKRESFNKQKAK